jgi:hypothetical protein
LFSFFNNIKLLRIVKSHLRLDHASSFHKQNSLTTTKYTKGLSFSVKYSTDRQQKWERRNGDMANEPLPRPASSESQTVDVRKWDSHQGTSLPIENV